MVNKEVVKKLVNELSELIDKCENDFEAMVFNPDGTFELLLTCHGVLSNLIQEVADDSEV